MRGRPRGSSRFSVATWNSRFRVLVIGCNCQVFGVDGFGSELSSSLHRIPAIQHWYWQQDLPLCKSSSTFTDQIALARCDDEFIGFDGCRPKYPDACLHLNSIDLAASAFIIDSIMCTFTGAKEILS